MSNILKGLNESYFSRDEQDQQNAMDTRRRSDLSGERNAGLNEPDEFSSKPVQMHNGIYEYDVPAGQENIAQELGLQFHKGHWFSRIPFQRADFQFGRPQFHAIPSKNVSEAEQDYGADYQDKVQRLGQMAKQGERKTVWDPVKRVYKTVPVNPPKEQGVAEGWKEKVAGGVLGAAALGGIGAGIAYSPMAYVNGQQIQMAMPTSIPDNAKLVTADDGRKIYVWKSNSIKGRTVWHYRPAEQVKEQGVAEGERMKTASGMYRDQHTGVAYRGKTGQDGNDSYMTPDYLIQKYQERLAQIASGPYKRPKEVAQLKSRIAKLQGKQGVAEGLNDTQKKIEDTINKLEDRLKHAKSDEQWDRISARIERLQAGLNRSKQGMAEGKKPDRYHIVNKDGKPASLASYADRESAVKDRDEKHPGAVVQQVGPRGKVKGVAEGLSKRDQQDVAAIRAAIARLEAQLNHPNADRDAIQQSIAHEKKRLALYGQGVTEDQRLDPSCWKGYKKQGTKMKGDTRVNNCVPVKESAIMKGLKS
jgi:uncharacterized small protein (DUF1192 family)